MEKETQKRLLFLAAGLALAGSLLLRPQEVPTFNGPIPPKSWLQEITGLKEPSLTNLRIQNPIFER